MDIKEKEEYQNRDYSDCNIRLNITIDIEAYDELKNILCCIIFYSILH